VRARTSGRRFTTGATFVAVLTGALLGAAGQASAAVESCVHDPVTKTVTASISTGSEATLKVAANGQLLFGLVPAPCGDATTTNTDLVTVTGTAGADDTFVLDQSDGFLGPGFTPEGNIPEIEVDTNLGDMTDRFVIYGTQGDDTIAAGVNGVAIDSDGDLDMTFNPGIFELEVHLLAGKNFFNGRGQGGAGLAFRGPLWIYGGDEGDELVGAWAADEIHGGAGDDLIYAHQENDVVYGNGGSDWISAGDGADLVVGGAGADNLLGGYGDDTLDAVDGDADAQIHGGGGTDTAYVDVPDPGTIAVENVIVDPGPPPPPPPPGGSCIYDAASGTVNAAIPANGSATLAVVAGGAIHFGETPTACGAATTANTDTITVVGQPGSVEHLTVDQTGGALAPGATAETSGLSEVEVAANLGDATDEVTVVGTSGDDTLSAGSKGVSVNTDSDEDVTFGIAPAHVELVGGGGVNVLTGRGGSGSGTVFAGRVTLRAGALGDRLDGGNLDDLLVGGAGPDVLDAGTGDDELRGGAGADVLKGSDGNDLLVGGAGADELNGSFGNDTIEADDGAADLLIHGGPGTDSAKVDGVDPGTISVETVEVVAGPPPPPPPPGGACTYNPVSGVVLAATPAGAAATLIVVGGAIHFGETPTACGDATTANTDSITVTGPSGSVERLTIDLSGGPLAPGASDEGPNGSSEIEIAVNLGEAADQVVVVGSPGDDTIAAGTKGLGLNDDRDVDVTFTVLPTTFELFGGGGDDSLSARGGAGAGPLFAGPVIIHGEDGNDTIAGSDLAELLAGGAGNDTIDAGAGNDTVQGGAGDDALTGGHGDDDLDGGLGTDQLFGNAGDDVVHADDGVADAELNGGAGTDTISYDAGLDLPVAFEVLHGL